MIFNECLSRSIYHTRELPIIKNSQKSSSKNLNYPLSLIVLIYELIQGHQDPLQDHQPG